jgi:hypothetical protein
MERRGKGLSFECMDCFSVKRKREGPASLKGENGMSINPHGRSYLCEELKYSIERSYVRSASLEK